MPELREGYDIVPYDIKDTYLDLFASLCDNSEPTCVLLTDSKFGSAFFEHRYLSELLDIPLVEGSDLYIGYEGDVRMKTLDGDVHVDLIYRRVEDLEIFVPGLTDVYLNGKVVLVNGMGTSVADDKLVFLWVPGHDSSLPWRRADSGSGSELRPGRSGKPRLCAGKP